MDWNYLLFTFLGFFIGIYVCFFYVFQTHKEEPKPTSNSKSFYLDDTVYWLGKKYKVVNIASCGTSESVCNIGIKFGDIILYVSPDEIKKVVRADSIDNAT